MRRKNISPPMTSPMHRHARSGSTGANLKKPNTKAAAQRLAQVMAHQSAADDSDEEDDLLYDYTPANASSIGLGAGGRAARPRSPMVTNCRLKKTNCSFIFYFFWE